MTKSYQKKEGVEEGRESLGERRKLGGSVVGSAESARLVAADDETLPENQRFKGFSHYITYNETRLRPNSCE